LLQTIAHYNRSAARRRGMITTIIIAAPFGAGFTVGDWRAVARHARLLEQIIRDDEADRIERETYHRAIVAWVRGREEA
jgi:hypothetical protein